jgi:hypothetical protein
MLDYVLSRGDPDKQFTLEYQEPRPVTAWRLDLDNGRA